MDTNELIFFKNVFLVYVNFLIEFILIKYILNYIYIIYKQF